MSVSRYLILSTLVFASVAHAGEGMPTEELAGSVAAAAGLSSEDAASVAKAAAKAASDKGSYISGVMSTSGINFAFFGDTDTWQLNASVWNPQSRQVERASSMFVKFEDGGLKIAAEYKHVMFFLLDGMTLGELEGVGFGRGIGGKAGIPFTSVYGLGLGAELAYLPANGRLGGLVAVSVTAGYNGLIILPWSVVFPKVTFSQDAATLK